MKFAYASGSRPLEGYTIKRGVGTGGFGQVYFAISDAGKEVALKHIQRNLDIELRGVSQCLNLKHPNLISLYDIRYDESGEGWVVMEYVAGESLKDVVESNPNGMSLEAVNHWIQGVCAGVSCLHDHGIVHRDLKPGNLFEDGETVKIGDYGLAKFVSVSRRSGQTESVGTLHYMAPEIGKGNYGKGIDIYALGVILYEMLTGRVPFEGESSQEIIMKHLTDDPDLTGIPQPYKKVIAGAMAKDPEKRISSVQDFIWQLNLSEASPRVESPERPVASAKLHRDVKEHERRIRQGDHQTVSKVKAKVSSEVEEPIAAAIRQSIQGLVAWYKDLNLNSLGRIALLAVGILLLAWTSEVWIPVVIFLATLYLFYFIIRAMLLGILGEPASPPPAALHPAAAPISEAIVVPPPAPSIPRSKARPKKRATREIRRRWHEMARESLVGKPWSQRIADLCGSMLMAVFVAMVLCVVMIIIGGLDQGRSAQPTFAFFTWLALTSISGTWMVLFLAKCWEGSRGEQVLRRFCLLVVGLLLGAMAYGFEKMLLITNGVGGFVSFPGNSLSNDILFGQPGLIESLIFFGVLFALLRWWRQADPLRVTRLSIWDTVVCVLCAWILDEFLHYPQPLGLMLAATISISVQLSAPWMNRQERSRIRKQIQEA